MKKYFFKPTFLVYGLLVVCFSSLFFANISNAETMSCKTAAEKIACEEALEQVLAEQKQAEKDLATAKGQSASLSRDIAILTAKIKTAELNIKAKNLRIQTLGQDINQKQSHIDELEVRITKGKESLAVLLRKTNELDQYSVPEMLLSQSDLSEFFEDIDYFESVQTGLKSTFEQLRSDQDETTTEKNDLDKRRNAEIDARYEIQQEQKNIAANQKEKQKLLALSKGSEKSYATLLAEKQAKAAMIRASLFQLAGAIEIPFGDAYKYALEAEKRTGIRPAFLLAIFAQESSLDKDATFGKYVGSCYLANKDTGAGIKITTKTPIANVMKPDRDVAPFLSITNELGLDPYATLVSCPLSTGGYGGAMGPAQFIPSTWVSSVADRVAKLLGISGMPNPWFPEHAFMASAMYLTDLGAAKQTYTAERTAALRYYAGGNWNAPKNAFYGNSVMVKAENIQRTMIDQL
jgi:peptidoglycan hydrolase CwlO-like protein